MYSESTLPAPQLYLLRHTLKGALESTRVSHKGTPVHDIRSKMSSGKCRADKDTACMTCCFHIIDDLSFFLV